MADMQSWIDALGHIDPEKRIEAINKLEEANHVDAAPHLADVLREDIDMGVRFQAAQVLARFADPNTVPEMLEALRGDDLWLRMAATEGLIRIGEPSVEGLITALNHANRAVRRASAKALGKIGDARAVTALRAALLDHDVDVRRFAAQAMGRIGQEETIDALSDALRDDSDRVRKAAASALVAIGEPSIPTLLEALQDPEPRVAIIAVVALRDLGYEPPEND
ncbi:MAG: HEAT repeat domain-containing protein [Anaerolineae bacterium]|nr:HEAT repeat domain-containing protein [Anaerolineae bacterium]